MMGLDEISHIFEQPFKFMPMYQISKVAMLDVADAFCRPPPPLRLGATGASSWIRSRPKYWAIKTDPSLPYDGRDVQV